MINVIRKTIDPTSNEISTELVPTTTINESLLLLGPVKATTTIKYNSKGHPDKTSVDLGSQFDHRVSFLDFDLEDLIWNQHQAHQERYNHYNFFLMISAPNGETTKWEFDGKTFEIARQITSYSGTYTFTLVIEEYIGDDMPGNIKDERAGHIERFITQSFKGVVNPTNFRPEEELTVYTMETDQLASLTKPGIECTLSDRGVLTLSDSVIGEKLDNYVSYLKFNPGGVTAHLNDFNLVAVFRQGTQVCGAFFETTNPDDPYDIRTHSLIAWIPSMVYQTPGTWTVSVIGWTGDAMNQDQTEEDDYYFYVSRETKVSVKNNTLKQEDIHREAKLTMTLKLLTSNGEYIEDPEGAYYTIK